MARMGRGAWWVVWIAILPGGCNQPPSSDAAAPADLSNPSNSPDQSHPATDASNRPDAAGTPDMGADLRPGVDGAAIDSSVRDLVAADLTALPDLTPPRDLTPPPDLELPATHVPSFSSQSFPTLPDGGNDAGMVFGGDRSSDAITADFDGDGRLDVATIDYGNGNWGLVVYLNRGNRTFVGPYVAGYDRVAPPLAAGDFNHDGKLDLIVLDGTGAGVVLLMLGHGDGTFAAPVTEAMISYPSTFAVGDFNGDGKTDVATCAFGDPTNNRLRVYLGNGVSFANGVAVSGACESVVAGDWNGDGKTDLAEMRLDGANPGALGVLISHGATFTETDTVVDTVDYQVDPGGSLQTADVNGDGKLDLLVQNTGLTMTPFNPMQVDGPTAVFLGDGNGGFNRVPNSGTGLPAVLADIDGDGRLDAAQGQTIIPGNGDGTFSQTNSVQVCMTGFFGAAGDFDGDGKADLITVLQSDALLTVLWNESYFGSPLPPFQAQTCTAPGQPCTPFPNQCHLGSCVLTGLSLDCQDNQLSVPDGTPCFGTNALCIGGVCYNNGTPQTSCGPNAAPLTTCTPPAAPCRIGMLLMGTVTGGLDDACFPTDLPAAEGASCGNLLTCQSGNCACPDGAACTPLDTCHVGQVFCGGMMPQCIDTLAAVADGTPCGATPTMQCVAGACTCVPYACNILYCGQDNGCGIKCTPGSGCKCIPTVSIDPSVPSYTPAPTSTADCCSGQTISLLRYGQMLQACCDINGSENWNGSYFDTGNCCNGIIEPAAPPAGRSMTYACGCGNIGDSCSSNQNCCNYHCVSGKCEPTGCSKLDGQACTQNAECCSGNPCLQGVCNGKTCLPNGSFCFHASDCCANTCAGSICGAVTCTPIAGNCTSNAECCTGACCQGSCNNPAACCVPPHGACQITAQCCGGYTCTCGGRCEGTALVPRGGSCNQDFNCCSGTCQPTTEGGRCE